jgi:hypothetical protein
VRQEIAMDARWQEIAMDARWQEIAMAEGMHEFHIPCRLNSF